MIDLHAIIKQAVKEAISESIKELNALKENSVESLVVDNDEKIYTVKAFCEKHSFITENALRSLLNYRSYNKFDMCISTIGRRIYIKEREALEFFTNPPPEANWKYDRRKYHPEEFKYK